MTTIEAARAMLEHNMEMASQAYKAVSGGGPMGLTPDNVKAGQPYQQARRAYDDAFKALRAFNAKHKPGRRS